MSEWIPWAGKGAALAALLIGASWRDIRSRIVPDFYSILIILVALFIPDTGKWWGIFCTLPFLIAALTVGGIGGADIKIMGAAGMVLGFWEGMAAMTMGLTGMLLFHTIKSLLRKGRKKEKSYPMVPFLAAGIILVYLTQIPGQ